MRRIAIAAVALTAVAGGALTANAAPTTPAGGAPPCMPQVKKLKGRPAVFECGPATGSLRSGGKSFTFKNGFCERSKSAGLTLELDLGKLAPTLKGNGGLPYLSIIGTRLGGTVNTSYGGKTIANGPVAISGRYPGQGTFTSKFSGPGFGAAFSGSWNSHGVIWQTP